jgi:predicted anti-sigma-YlaC factor YlaD
MELNCKHVWGYISDYIDGSVDREVRLLIERHLEHCEICSAILDSTRNILYLTADDRTFALPVGYSARLHARLEKELAALLRPDGTNSEATGRDGG